MQEDLSWQQLIHNWSAAELRFALQAPADTTPAATNLCRWELSCRQVDPACILCGKPATLRHMLNGCSVALRQGQLTWSHNSVTLAIKHRLTTFWEQSETQQAVQATVSTTAEGKSQFLCFVRRGEPLPQNAKPLNLAGPLRLKPSFFKQMIGNSSLSLKGSCNSLLKKQRRR